MTTNVAIFNTTTGKIYNTYSVSDEDPADYLDDVTPTGHQGIITGFGTTPWTHYINNPSFSPAVTAKGVLTNNFTDSSITANGSDTTTISLPTGTRVRVSYEAAVDQNESDFLEFSITNGVLNFNTESPGVYTFVIDSIKHLEAQRQVTAS